MDHSPIIQHLLSFLDSSPSAWHAVQKAGEWLKQSNFLELSEHKPWHIQPGQRYSVTRQGSSLCAFITPQLLPRRIRLLASHTDSPGLKLKPCPEIRKNHAVLLGVEIYGSPLLNSWLNRDLGIAGRIFYTDSQQHIKETLVRFDRYPAVIPQLALHLDREINEKGLLLNKQEHLNALVGVEHSFGSSSFLEALLKEELDFDSILGHDLFLFPLERARLVGYQQAFLAAHRIDSLTSMHAALTAFLHNPSPLEEEIKMVIFWDHEEIGSHTAQGAKSPFFNQILERILEGLGGTKEDYFCLLNNSICVSIDLAHAVHPNHTDKHDPQHQPFLGQGIIIKNNAQERYATNARTALPIQLAAAFNKLPLQRFVNRNDQPGGSTIGPLHACLTGMPTVDIGCGQLSMHSCRELMSCRDHLDMCELLTHLMHRKASYSPSKILSTIPPP